MPCVSARPAAAPGEETCGVAAVEEGVVAPDPAGQWATAWARGARLPPAAVSEGAEEGAAAKAETGDSPARGADDYAHKTNQPASF